ncbi:WD repeat-containing protein 89-like isoform X2 [Physella acuta]|nr:WD repeat-containing protein 89-like isoform X2 [Physella acuta]
MDDWSTMMRSLQNLKLADKSAVELTKSEPDYILDITQQNNTSDPLLAAACSNKTIKILSRERLTPLSVLSGHQDTITKVEFAKTESHLLFSTSRDRTTRCWDTRLKTNKEVKTFNSPDSVQADFLSLDVSQSDRLLCVGTESAKDAYLMFWDVRNPDVLGCYSECHEDDITQVKFQAGSDEYLASGSADGLVCVFDLKETTEDDALQMTWNALSCVVCIGWCGENRTEYVYCVTSDNSFHMWDNLQGEPSCTIEELSSTFTEPSDYIVNCIPELTGVEGNAVLLTGTYEGGLKLMSYKDKSKILDLPNGHTATVRCSLWDQKTATLVTGGEDALVCLWSQQGSFHSVNTDIKKSKMKGNKSTEKPYSRKKKS